MGHIDWSNNYVIPGKPYHYQHQFLLNLVNDTNLHHIVDIPTRKDRILDLIMVNNPTHITKVSTLPPIGLTDHDTVYVEADIWPKELQEHLV